MERITEQVRGDQPQEQYPYQDDDPEMVRLLELFSRDINKEDRRPFDQKEKAAQEISTLAQTALDSSTDLEAFCSFGVSTSGGEGETEQKVNKAASSHLHKKKKKKKAKGKKSKGKAKVRSHKKLLPLKERKTQYLGHFRDFIPTAFGRLIDRIERAEEHKQPETIAALKEVVSQELTSALESELLKKKEDIKFSEAETATLTVEDVKIRKELEELLGDGFTSALKDHRSSCYKPTREWRRFITKYYEKSDLCNMENYIPFFCHLGNLHLSDYRNGTHYGSFKMCKAHLCRDIMSTVAAVLNVSEGGEAAVYLSHLCNLCNFDAEDTVSMSQLFKTLVEVYDADLNKIEGPLTKHAIKLYHAKVVGVRIDRVFADTVSFIDEFDIDVIEQGVSTVNLDTELSIVKKRVDTQRAAFVISCSAEFTKKGDRKLLEKAGIDLSSFLRMYFDEKHCLLSSAQKEIYVLQQNHDEVLQRAFARFAIREESRDLREFLDWFYKTIFLTQYVRRNCYRNFTSVLRHFINYIDYILALDFSNHEEIDSFIIGCTSICLLEDVDKGRLVAAAAQQALNKSKPSQQRVGDFLLNFKRIFDERHPGKTEEMAAVLEEASLFESADV